MLRGRCDVVARAREDVHRTGDAAEVDAVATV